MAITLSGTEVFLSDLERMIPSDTNVDAALAEGAEVIAKEMRQLAPVKSGKLKSAIKVGKARNGRNGRQVTVGVHRRDFSGDEYYPAYVEYGHGGPRPAPPHPFIRPAFDLKKDEAWNTVKQAVIDQMNAKGL
ncbi:MAG TPA: HK97 gp10 family phage protein [Clostridia bacterium]|nr:HK97 gp10 family phage protein [Clostridia bacterium]